MSESQSLFLLVTLLGMTFVSIRAGYWPVAAITVFLTWGVASQKLEKIFEGARHMLFSKDKKWKKGPDPKQIEGDVDLITAPYVRIIWIRHGESNWNEVFNKSPKILLPVRLIRALFTEALMVADSIFFDSPLCKEGIEQAERLLKDLDKFDGAMPQNPTKEERERIEIMNMLKMGDASGVKSVVVGSNLRRALATVLIGLWRRLSATGEKVKILSSLQEVTFNIDGVAIANAYECPPLPRVTSFAKTQNGATFNSNKMVDPELNKGNKSTTSNGYTRFKEFAQWAFEFSDKNDINNVIVGSHSLYARYFFQSFIPYDVKCDAKEFKIRNCGIVSCKLYQVKKDKSTRYYVDPASIVEVYKVGHDSAFEIKKSMKNKKTD